MVSYEFDVEFKVLGSLILYRSELDDKLNLLNDKDFKHDTCKQIFQFVKCTTKDFTAETIIFKAETQELKEMLMAACAQAGTLHTFQSDLSELLSLSQGRRIKAKLAEMLLSEFYPEISEIEKIIEDEKNSAVTQGYAEKSIASVENYIANLTVKNEVINLGFSDIDKTIGGLRIPSVSIIGAAPSSGKTAFALNIANKQQGSVVIFSLEMSAAMLIERLAADELSIDYYRIQHKSFDKKEAQSIKEFAELLKKQDIYFFDDIYDIEQQARIIAELKPKLVIVDYVQKVKTKKKTENRRNEIEYISGEYKRIANYNNCHIMLLSQITRNDRGIPTMASLKESGALEADGDYVMLLHRPYVIDKKKYKPSESYLLIDKNKFGGTGEVSLFFDGQYQRFRLENKFYKDVIKLDSNGDYPF